MQERGKEGEGFSFSFSIFITKHILSKSPWMSHNANPEGGRHNFVNCKSEILFAVDTEHIGSYQHNIVMLNSSVMDAPSLRRGDRAI